MGEPESPTLVHGTVIAVGDRAVLIRGPSGSGKSDLALRCLMSGNGLGDGLVRLVADDYAEVANRGGVLFVKAPAAIRGLLEIRGLGIRKIAAAAEEARLALIADLRPPEDIERLPDTGVRESILEVDVPVTAFAAFEASAAAKIIVALSPVAAAPIDSTS